MGKRKPLTKKARFEVFKRDGFTCRYCGNTPPAVILEVDHIEPVCEGGTNDPDNLITACFDCNRGKGGTRLSSAPPTIKQKADAVREAEAQLAAYRLVIEEKRLRENDDIDEVEDVFNTRFETHGFSDKFRQDIRLSFLPFLTTDQLCDAMSMAVGRVNDPEKALKYFCGICWNWRRDK